MSPSRQSPSGPPPGPGRVLAVLAVACLVAGTAVTVFVILQARGRPAAPPPRPAWQGELEQLAQSVHGWMSERDLSELPATFTLEVLASGENPRLEPEALLDPWGRAYRLRRTDGGFELTGLGADGSVGGTGEDADVTILVRAAPMSFGGR